MLLNERFYRVPLIGGKHKQNFQMMLNKFEKDRRKYRSLVRYFLNVTSQQDLGQSCLATDSLGLRTSHVEKPALVKQPRDFSVLKLVIVCK